MFITWNTNYLVSVSTFTLLSLRVHSHKLSLYLVNQEDEIIKPVTRQSVKCCGLNGTFASSSNYHCISVISNECHSFLNHPQLIARSATYSGLQQRKHQRFALLVAGTPIPMTESGGFPSQRPEMQKGFPCRIINSGSSVYYKISIFL